MTNNYYVKINIIFVYKKLIGFYVMISYNNNLLKHSLKFNPINHIEEEQYPEKPNL